MTRISALAGYLKDFFESNMSKSFVGYNKGAKNESVFTACILHVSEGKIEVKSKDPKDIIILHSKMEEVRDGNGDLVAVEKKNKMTGEKEKVIVSPIVEDEGKIIIIDIQLLLYMLDDYDSEERVYIEQESGKKVHIFNKDKSNTNEMNTIEESFIVTDVANMGVSEVMNMPYYDTIDLLSPDPTLGNNEIVGHFVMDIGELSGLEKNASKIVKDDRVQFRVTSEGLEIETGKPGSKVRRLKKIDIDWRSEPVMFGNVYSRGLYTAIKYLSGDCDFFLAENEDLIIRDTDLGYTIKAMVEE